MTPDEVLRMPLEEALIILRGQKVFRVRKFDYTKHPDSKKLKKRKIVKYIPAWRLDGEQEKKAVKKESVKPKAEISVAKERKTILKAATAKELKKEEPQQLELDMPKREFIPISKKELMRKPKGE